MDQTADRHVDHLTDADLGEPLTYPVDAFVSREYAAAENDRLWSKVWQMAAREEDVPDVGDFITYNIADESIIIIRTAPDALKAYYNVCPHRGRQLVNTPDDVNCVTGRRRTFVCGFHGWAFNREGKNINVLDKEDWKGALTDERTCLSEVRVDTWGGWIYVNMDPAAESLEEFLRPAARILDHFEFDKMRYKWRQWTVYPCNWKTAIEAFMEPYHVSGTHPQLLKYGQYYAYSKPYGLHGVSGFDERDASFKMSQSSSVTRAGLGDPRVSTYELATGELRDGQLCGLHRDFGECGEAIGRRTARGNSGGRCHRPLAGVRQGRRCRTRGDLARDSAGSHGRSRACVELVPQSDDLARCYVRALLSGSALR